MRVSDQRYDRDVLRHHLAVRLIQFEVRTGQIQRWTGLSDARIRGLYRSCGPAAGESAVIRRRGLSPKKVTGFISTAAARNESATLIGLLRVMGVSVAAQNHTRASTSVDDLERGENFCDAYEAYRALFPQARYSLERALLLWQAALEAVELGVGHCIDCDALVVYDVLGTSRRVCNYCAKDDEYAEIEHSLSISPLQMVADDSACYQHRLL